MKDPKVIIMDEPTLGIDPEGMRILLQLIRELAREDGRTILISPHQLYQVQQICDRVGIFVHGQLIACGNVEELGRQLENQGLQILDVQLEPQKDDAETWLREIEGVRSVERTVEGFWRLEADRDIRQQLTWMAAEAGLAIGQLHQRGGDLDEIYRKYFEKAGEQDDKAYPVMDKHKIRRLLQKEKSRH